MKSFKMFKFVVITCVIALVQASRTPLEIKQYMLSKSMDCTANHSVSSKELQMMMNHQLPNTKSSNCFIACVLKKFGWIDERGLYDVAAAGKFAETEFADDATKLDNAKKVFDICKGVNDETPADGEAGCDRAYSLANCLLENAPKFGFHLQLGGQSK